jgi:hypothetical protein
MMTCRFKNIILLLGALIWAALMPARGGAQQIQAIATQWNDSFDEWTIITDLEEDGGYLRRRPGGAQDGQIWDYRVGEYSGSIKVRWSANPLEWEARGENRIATARSLWRDRPNEWRLSLPGGKAATWRSRYANLLEDWGLYDLPGGAFQVYAAYEGDPRVWMVADEWPEGWLPEKMLLITLSIVYGTGLAR